MAGIDLGKVLEQLTGRRSGGASSRSGKVPDIGGYFDKLVKQGKRATTKQRRKKLPDEGVVAVEYAPNRDGDPDPGEVVWAWVPFEEDPTQGKDRPVVVIGRRGDDLVGIPLTTKVNDREAQVAVGTGDWDPQRRQSYARIWRILDLDESAMRRESSSLPRDKFDAVVASVDEYYDVSYPDY